MRFQRIPGLIILFCGTITSGLLAESLPPASHWVPSEAIVCLESVLIRSTVTPAERIARARDLRGVLQPRAFKARDIDAAKRRGRA